VHDEPLPDELSWSRNAMLAVRVGTT
jgi:hypothetical protein